MTKSNSDKRSFPRVAISREVHILENENRRTVEMVDLSVEGISFKLDRPLPVGSLITLEIKESEDLSANKLKVEVLRCYSPANVNPPQYNPYFIAAKFVEVNDEFLMDSLALVHGKKNQP